MKCWTLPVSARACEEVAVPLRRGSGASKCAGEIHVPRPLSTGGGGRTREREMEAEWVLAGYPVAQSYVSFFSFIPSRYSFPFHKANHEGLNPPVFSSPFPFLSLSLSLSLSL